MPDTKPQVITIKELEERVSNAHLDLKEAQLNAEAVRKASPATVEMVETVIARLDGLHWQSVNHCKSIKATEDFISALNRTVKIPNGKFMGWMILLSMIAFYVALCFIPTVTNIPAPWTAKDYLIASAWLVMNASCFFGGVKLIENGE